MPGVNPHGMDGGNSTSNGIYGDYDPQYGRSYLPYLPKRIKNKSLDRHRQSLNTSNEAYGEFWTNTVPSYTTSPRSEYSSFRPAGLPSDSEELDRHRQGDYKYVMGGYASDKLSPRQGDKKDLLLPSIYSHRQTLSHNPPPATPMRPITSKRSPRVDLSRRIEFPSTSNSSSSYGQRIDLLNDKNDQLVARFDPQSDLHMPDIQSIDIMVHMKNDTTVMLKSLPFSYWDKLS